jgi:curved DNA-binding protein CbpA
VTRGRSSAYYWEICRTGRRRGVTPEFVIDRASVLLASIEERQRTDIYRVLGVPPLASEDAIKQRWHEVAKQIHPDVGGDASHFRQVKEAFEILRDDTRREEYERFWLRAVGPIARLADGDDVPPAPTPSGIPRPQRERRVVMVAKRQATPLTEPTSEKGRALLDGIGRLGEAHADLDRRLTEAGLGGVTGTQGVLQRLESLLLPLDHDEIARARAEIDAGIASVENIRAELEALAGLKRLLA